MGGCRACWPRERSLLEERNNGLASGVNDFVTKSFAPDFLKQVILKWLERAAPQGEEDHAPKAEEPPGEQIDLSYLHAMSGGDETFIQDMIQTFLKEIPEMIQQVEGSLQGKLAKELCGVVHKFKPSLSMLGLKQQEKTCAKIEQMTKESPPDWSALQSNCHKLLRVVGKAQHDLQHHYSKIPEER